MNKKEKKSPNVLIRVKAEHAYSEVGNKNYEGRITKQVISVNMKTKTIGFAAHYKGYAKSHRISFKMEQIGKVEIHQEGLLKIELDPLQQNGHILLAVNLQDPQNFYKVRDNSQSRKITAPSKILQCARSHSFEKGNIIQIQSEKEEQELLEAQALIKEDLDKPEIITPKKKSPLQPKRRSLRLQQQPSSPTKKTNRRGVKNKVPAEKQKQASIETFLKRNMETKEETKEEVKIKLQPLASESQLRRNHQEMETQLRRILRRASAEMEANCALFSFQTVSYLIQENLAKLLSSVPKEEKLFQKYHWILPYDLEGQLYIAILTHPYNTYNHAITDRAKSYNSKVVKSIIKQDPLAYENQFKTETERSKLIILGEPTPEAEQTIHQTIRSLLSFRFFVEYALIPGQNSNIEGQLKPIKIGPFSEVQANIQEGKPIHNLYKFFFLNQNNWSQNSLQEYFESISIPGSNGWPKIVGGLQLFAHNFRFLSCYARRKEQIEEARIFFTEVKREAQSTALGELPLEELGRIGQDEIKKEENQGLQELKEKVDLIEVVFEKFGGILEECAKVESRFDQRGLRVIDDIKEEQKSVGGRG